MQKPKTPPADETPVQKLSAFLTDLAIARLCAKGKQPRCDCMALPSPVFEQFCRMILDRKLEVGDALKWLREMTKTPPRRSSIYRFSARLSREYLAACRDYAQRGR